VIPTDEAHMIAIQTIETLRSQPLDADIATKELVDA
jgi:hypothetical protein